MYKTRWLLYLLLGSLLAGYSCKSTEKVSKLKKTNLNELLERLESNTREYEYFSAKAKLKYNGPELNVSGRSNIRMIKDSLTWMNFKKVSIEGSRALMTQDSFWILYRFDDIYEAGSFDELMDYYKIGLSFDDFQDLIVGNHYVPTPDQVQSLNTEALHILDFQRGVNRYQYGIDGDFMIRKMLVSDPYGRTVIVTMDDFGEEGIAQSKDCQILLEDGQTATISIGLNDIEFDVPKTIKFDIPQHYTRIP